MLSLTPCRAFLKSAVLAWLVRLDTGAKRLMDAIKITARNLFYQALVPFKKAYDLIAQIPCRIPLASVS